jgi:hypothetical protein
MSDRIQIKPVGPSSTAGLETGLQRAPQSSGPGSAVRALSPITPGPAALRSAMLDMCIALAAGLGTEWSQEKCKAQVAAGPLGLIRAHDMQVRRK